MTVGKVTYELPAFNFAIATMNPIELGQGTFPLSEAATDRFAIMVNIAYLKPEEEEKLVNFDFKKVRLRGLMSKERIIELRGAVTREVFLHDALATYIRRLVGATRPYNAETEWLHRSPSELVEKAVDLGAFFGADLHLDQSQVTGYRRLMRDILHIDHVDQLI